MHWVSAVIVFILVWWTTIFCVLPIGMAKFYEQQEQGIAPGSPKNLNIKKIFIVTTLISIFIWAIIMMLIAYDILDLKHIIK